MEASKTLGILTMRTENKIERIVSQPHKNLICSYRKWRMKFWCLHLKNRTAELEAGDINEDIGTTVLLDIQQVGTISFGRKITLGRT